MQLDVRMTNTGCLSPNAASRNPGGNGCARGRTSPLLIFFRRPIELEAAALRWWRSDPERVLENGLFAVTVATFPVAVYMIAIDGHSGSIRCPGERFDRQQYIGTLLARVGPGMAPRVSPDLPDWLEEPARQIMGSIIEVVAGGPVGYLTSPDEMQ